MCACMWLHAGMGPHTRVCCGQTNRCGASGRASPPFAAPGSASPPWSAVLGPQHSMARRCSDAGAAFPPGHPHMLRFPCRFLPGLWLPAGELLIFFCDCLPTSLLPPLLLMGGRKSRLMNAEASASTAPEESECSVLEEEESRLLETSGLSGSVAVMRCISSCVWQLFAMALVPSLVTPGRSCLCWGTSRAASEKARTSPRRMMAAFPQPLGAGSHLRGSPLRSTVSPSIQVSKRSFSRRDTQHPQT